jgi:hypothetical protein
VPPLARHQRPDLLPDALRGGPLAGQHARCQAVALADQAQQEVLGAQIAVVEASRFVPGEIDPAFGAGRDMRLLSRVPRLPR